MYTILLTDDEQIMIDSLTMTLTKNFGSQIKLFSALSGSEALEIVAKNQIDIIFMDINMPGLNGLQTVSYIKQSKKDTVVIILSAFDEFEYAKEALNIGAFKYLTKPVNRNTVIDTIKSAFDEIDKKRGRISDEVELHKKLEIVLKYGPSGEKVISGLKRISKPGLRVTADAKHIPSVLKGLGIAIISTSKGVMTDKLARKNNVGGEVIAYIW